VRSVALLVTLVGCGAFYHVDPSAGDDGSATGHDATVADSERDARAIGGDAPQAIDAPQNLDAPPSSAFACPSGYAPVSGETHSYKFATGVSSWADARTSCLGSGTGGAYTHLLVAGSDAELDDVADALGANGTLYWIGLSDVSSSSRVWVTTEVDGAVFPPSNDLRWMVGTMAEPGQCVALSHTNRVLLTDTACIGAAPYICECDAFPDRSVTTSQ
jgi:hypothetical protein